MNWDRGLKRLYIIATVIFLVGTAGDAQKDGDYWAYPRCMEESLVTEGVIPKICPRDKLDKVARSISESTVTETIFWYWHWFAGYFYFWVGLTVFLSAIRWAFMDFKSIKEEEE